MNQTRGYILALISTLAFSMTGILIKYLLTNFGLPPLTLATLRCGILSITMLIALGILRPGWLRLKRQDLPFYLGYGLVGVALSQTFWINSVNLNGAALATVLFYISPAFVIIYSRLALGEPITRAKQVALALIFAGSALVARVYDLTLLRLGLAGVLVGLASGAVYSSYTIFSKEATRRHHPFAAMAFAFAIGTLFLSLTQWRSNLFILGGNLRAWGALALLAVGPTLGGYALYTLSLRDLSASIVSLILPLEMVFTSAVAYLVFGEMLHPLQILGGALIAFSIVLLRPRGASAPAAARKDRP